MAVSLQVRFPNFDVTDEVHVINEQTLERSCEIEILDNPAISTDNGNKQYLLFVGPDDCVIYGCLLTSLELCEVPVAQLLIGIFSCQHCSSTYRNGTSLELSIRLYKLTSNNPLVQKSFSIQSASSFASSLCESSKTAPAPLINLNSFAVCYFGSPPNSRTLKAHLTGNSYSRDVTMLDSKFNGCMGRFIFSNEERPHSQLVSQILTVTVRLAGPINVDQHNRRHHGHQTISSMMWSNLSLLLYCRSAKPLSLCHVVRSQSSSQNSKSCVVFITFDISKADENVVLSDNGSQLGVGRPNSRNTISTSSNEGSGGAHSSTSSSSASRRRLTGTGAMDTLPRLQRYPRVTAETPLPAGWEARLDSNGKMFFVDHVNRTTTWQRPQLPSPPDGAGIQQSSSGSALNRILPREDSRRTQLAPPDTPQQMSATAAAAAVRQRDQFVRRNESFRRLIASENNQGNNSNSANRLSRSSSNHGANNDSVPHMDVRELMEMPAVRFLTRPDLLTFLAQPDSDTPEVDAARAQFNQSSVVRHIVKHIRRDPQRFVKYQHNRELVHFLCGMAERDKPLPSGWDVRMDQSGRPFFLDHTHRTTTYIDPRLPLEQAVLAQTNAVGIGGGRLSTGPNALTTSSVRNVTHRTQIVDRDASTGQQDTDFEPPPPMIIDYSDRVIAWLKQADTESTLLSRYPPYRQSSSLPDKIRRIVRHGRSALDHYSNDVNIAQMLSFFENEINSCQISSSALISGNSLSKASNLDGRYDAFRAKVRNFYKKMASKGYGQGPAKLRLDIRRDHVLEDSFTLLNAASRRTLQKSRLIINFNTEEGLDYGGPQREFFFLVSQHLFNPYYGLFEYATSNSYAVHISPMSQYVDNAMQWYRFAGRVIALSLVHQHLLDAFFTPTFYKLLLRRRPTLDDLEAEDPQFYQSLVYIRDNDITELDLSLTFSTTEDVGGRVVEHELKPGGKNLAVTERNKAEYIQLVVDWRIQRSIAPQARQLQTGFAELLDPKLIEIFDARELELLIAGIPEIDLDDWRHNTEYRGGYHDGHPLIRWFWMAVERMDNDHRLRLLQFVTGTASLPYEGFAALRGNVGHARKFCIERWGSPDALPRAHTCFNRLDLPPYPSFQVLFDKLLLAVDESQTFGIE